MRSVITSSGSCVSGLGSKWSRGRMHTFVATSTSSEASCIMSLTSVTKKKLSLNTMRWNSIWCCYYLYSNNFKQNVLYLQFFHIWVADVVLICSTDPLNFMLTLPAPSFLSPRVYRQLSSVYQLVISWPKQTEFIFLIRIDSLVSCTALFCYGLMWKISGTANFCSICKMLAHDNWMSLKH